MRLRSGPDVLAMACQALVAMRTEFLLSVFGDEHGPEEVRIVRSQTAMWARPVDRVTKVRFFVVMWEHVIVGYCKIVTGDKRWCVDIRPSDGPREMTYVSEVFCRVPGLGSIVTSLAMALSMREQSKYVQLLVVREVQVPPPSENGKRQRSGTDYERNPMYDKLRRLYEQFGLRVVKKEQRGPEDFVSVHVSVLDKKLAAMLSQLFPLQPWQLEKLNNQKRLDMGRDPWIVAPMTLRPVGLEEVSARPLLCCGVPQLGFAKGVIIPVQKEFQGVFYRGMAEYKLPFYAVRYTDGDREDMTAASVLEHMDLSRDCEAKAV